MGTTDGPHDITAVARDPGGNEGTDSIVVTLDNASAVNMPPVVNAGPDRGIALPANTIDLSGTASDDGLPGGALTISWAAIDPPFPVAFADRSAFTTEVTFGGAGSYLLQLTASDGSLSASDDVVITVLPAASEDGSSVAWSGAPPPAARCACPPSLPAS